MNEETIENRPLACITGASSGIGLELARVFAKNGFDLLIAAENKQIHEVAKELRAFGVDVESCQMDLSTYDGVEDLYTKIETMPAPLDTLCLNAGVGVSGNFTTTSLEDELNLIQLNIMFTSSIVATMPGPYFAVYAASKAFVQSFAEALYTEFEETGITVMALQPGPTDTNFFERAEMMDTPAGQGKKDEPAKDAEQAYNALMKEKDHIVAGSLKNKLQATVAKFVSQHKGSEMQGKQTKPQQ
jgi:short-subunit dehydrogenase